MRIFSNPCATGEADQAEATHLSLNVHHGDLTWTPREARKQVRDFATVKGNESQALTVRGHRKTRSTVTELQPIGLA